MRARIILADESPSYRRFLRRVLEEDFDVIAAVPDGDKAFQLTQELAPDVVLLGLALAECDGLAVIRRIMESIRGTKVLSLSMHNDLAYVEEALKAGASGFLLKSTERAEVVRAVHHVMGGGIYVGAGLLRDEASDLRHPP